MTTSPRPNVTIRIDRPAERALRRGNPWLFDRSIQRQSHDGARGDHAVIFDSKRKLLAIGLYDPDSPIRVRVLHRGKSTPIDASFFASRIRDLVEKRASIAATGTTGYRLVHGENEGLPGLVVDRYDRVLVLKLDTTAWVPHLPLVTQALLAVQPADAIVLRASRSVDLASETLVGTLPEAPIVFSENQLRFEVDPVAGQKTGFFLDQRENRARLERLTRGASVLNVFSYTGGFSVYAARGGAERVTSLDSSAPALAAAERNFALNREFPNVARATHETVCEDAFEYLERAKRSGQLFDVVVLDPPSFARRASQTSAAIASYRRLNRLGLAVLKRDGWLVTASCSARVTADEFFEAVADAGRRQGRRIHDVTRTAEPLDHPVTFAEGAYLKCLFGKVT